MKKYFIYSLFIIFISLIFINNKKDVYEYYKIEKINDVERYSLYGYINSKKYEIIDKTNKNINNLVVGEINKPIWVDYFKDINLYLLINYCKIKCNTSFTKINKNKNYTLLEDSNGYTYIGSENGEFGFSIFNESYRPKQCENLVYKENEKICYDINYIELDNKYTQQIEKLFEKLAESYIITIDKNYNPYNQNLSYTVKLKYRSGIIDQSWIFDYGPDGLYSLQGYYNSIKETIDFKKISLKNAINLYQGDNKMYQLMPDLNYDTIKFESKDNDSLIINDFTVKYKKIIYKGRLLISPFYYVFTNNGPYYIPAIKLK
jgi:hypothetical protein